MSVFQVQFLFGRGSLTFSHSMLKVPSLICKGKLSEKPSAPPDLCDVRSEV